MRPAPMPQHEALPVELLMMPSEPQRAAAAVAPEPQPTPDRSPPPAVAIPAEPVSPPVPRPVPPPEPGPPAPRPVRRVQAQPRPPLLPPKSQANTQSATEAEASAFPSVPAPQAAQQEQPAHPDAAWLVTVSAWLRDHITYPENARRLGRQGTVVVQATIDPEGHVLDAVVMHGSGVPMLDEAAQALIRDAHLPPFPPNMKIQRQKIELPIRYRLD